MSNFISIFVEEHGQPPAFNIFESCEQIAKRFVKIRISNKNISILLVIN
jgi:hypothetical protein